MWLVTEASSLVPREINSFICESEDVAIDLFCKLVSEYGVEAYDEMIDRREFVATDYIVFYNPVMIYTNKPLGVKNV